MVFQHAVANHSSKRGVRPFHSRYDLCSWWLVIGLVFNLRTLRLVQVFSRFATKCKTHFQLKTLPFQNGLTVMLWLCFDDLGLIRVTLFMLTSDAFIHNNCKAMFCGIEKFDDTHPETLPPAMTAGKGKDSSGSGSEEEPNAGAATNDSSSNSNGTADGSSATNPLHGK